MTSTTLPQTDKQAQSLFEQGYRCFVHDRQRLRVRKPDGTCYLLNPYTQSCSCPAGSRGLLCKHRKQIVSLVFLSMSAMELRGCRSSAERLCIFWGNYIAWHARPRKEFVAPSSDRVTPNILHPGYDPEQVVR